MRVLDLGHRWGAGVMETLKGIGGFFVAICVLMLFVGVGVTLFAGVTWAAVHLTDYAITASSVVLAVCVVVLLPLSLFRATRIIAVWGFMIASYVFGASVWLAGFLVTLFYFGTVGVIIGVVFCFVGVVPVGILAATIHADWENTGFLILGLFLTFGSRSLAVWLASLIDRAYGLA
jgi:hypothetical protein